MRQKVLAIDPGYATCGVSLVSYNYSGPLEPVIEMCRTYDYPAKAGSTTQRIIALVGDVLNVVDVSEVDHLVVEGWKIDKKRATTNYHRGMTDGAWLVVAYLYRMWLISIDLNDLKRFVHPEGKATDRGRGSDIEFLAARNRLDTVFPPEQLDMISNPSIGSGQKRLKSGKDHTLDATILASIFMCCQRFDTTTGRVEGIMLSEAQQTAIRNLMDSKGVAAEPRLL